MVIRFNWLMYSVVIGFLRKGDKMKNVQKKDEPDVRKNVGERVHWKRSDPPGYIPGMTVGKAVRKESEVQAVQERKRKEYRQEDELLHQAQKAITELKPLIMTAGITKQCKHDLLLSLLHLLRSYASLTVLQAYPFRVAINNFIESESASRCSIHLNNEELLAMWRDIR
jgi:hypothetical protein